jgi:hypothetical protein
VHSAAHLEPERPDDLANRRCTGDPAGRRVEDGQKAITGFAHFAGAPVAQGLADGDVVALEELVPGLVPQVGGALGRADQVGE